MSFLENLTSSKTDINCIDVANKNLIEKQKTVKSIINDRINKNSIFSRTESRFSDDSLSSSTIFTISNLNCDPFLLRYPSDKLLGDTVTDILPKVVISDSLYVIKSLNIISNLKNDDKNYHRNEKVPKRKKANDNIINRLNCFKKLNLKRKLNEEKNIVKKSSLKTKKCFIFNNEHILMENLTDSYKFEKPKSIKENIKTFDSEMDFPIKKESEKLLFVSTKISSKFLLGPVNPEDKNKKCCIIDLDETLVHSSFKPLSHFDFKVNVEIEGTIFEIFVIKRPYADLFLSKMGQLFECVLFTASLSKYANLVMDILDKSNIFRWRLFREACVYYRGSFVKDLSSLGRPIDEIVILDNSAMSFLFNVKNAIHIISWYDDPKDTALLDIIPFCERLANSTSVIKFLQTEIPPPSSAWPIRQRLSYSPQFLSSKQSSSDNIPFKDEKNPITSSLSNVLETRKSSSINKANYPEKIKSPFISPLIRSFFSRTMGKSQSDTSQGTSAPSPPDIRRNQINSSLNIYKINYSKSSSSTDANSAVEAQLRSSFRNSGTKNIAFNTSQK